MKLIIEIEIDGKLRRVGEIVRSASGDPQFIYDREYLSSESAAPLSISLPLGPEPFSADMTRRFFEGLLPEGFSRRTTAQWLHAEEGDYLAILHGLGRECLGAICVREEGEHPEALYQELEDQDVRALASEGVIRTAELVTKMHLSLTGASGKAGLYYAADRGKWYLQMGTAPSTHIVKQSHVRLAEIVTNEQLVLTTASLCGIPVPESFILNKGEGGDDEILFATRRYDRVLRSDGPQVSGLVRPYRLHQEDMAQAMGISSQEKYEKEKKGYLGQMFTLLRQYASDPIGDQVRLWDLIVFNYLVGNTDAHLKNHSLLYHSDLSGLGLAPAYDLVSTTIYEQSTREMAMYIGDDLSIDAITESSFRAAADEAGIGRGMAMRRYDAMCDRFEEALNEASGRLEAEGFAGARGIRDRILRTGGIHRVL